MKTDDEPKRNKQVDMLSDLAQRNQTKHDKCKHTSPLGTRGDLKWSIDSIPERWHRGSSKDGDRQRLLQQESTKQHTQHKELQRMRVTSKIYPLFRRRLVKKVAVV